MPHALPAVSLDISSAEAQLGHVHTTHTSSHLQIPTLFHDISELLGALADRSILRTVVRKSNRIAIDNVSVDCAAVDLTG